MALGEVNIFQKSLEAGADVGQYVALKFGTDENKVIEATAQTDAVIGVSQCAAKAGEKVPFMIYGITKCKVGADVALGGFVRSGADGEIHPAIATQKYFGIAGSAGSDGDLVPVILQQGQV